MAQLPEIDQSASHLVHFAEVVPGLDRSARHLQVKGVVQVTLLFLGQARQVNRSLR